MQKRNKIIVAFAVLVILLFIAAIFPVYRQLNIGDTKGQVILNYPFLRSEFLCSLVGGHFDTDLVDWRAKDTPFCIVVNKTICRLRAGQIIRTGMEDIGFDPRDVYLLAPESSCRKK